ncbi:bifunctional methylenetetrahydrofolate dehydrogenase/methenyltetrahydrofolate cyclohydrolase [Clostridium swellfunianum]|uniref:bifunctional 5,10-methylenetetrahydrofolate dehydrogenase/5,10-methenyltetrahydrofolate cyclohydrolase n=1 Tax=Clostridium swellfunianum TaxID=1367462 RepID=UPI002030895F|nr:tetrahydrofolate dehydrogenase/cyclohydrolase catalytic domain-containing protein [Clostridium swellfunianum]MCM0650369.1 bifunctional methylenetetrahydrofolate dehydrogenase/methenyltetrahydrofolate cyclohydrolase [Clostridium swellfunianum]
MGSIIDGRVAASAIKEEIKTFVEKAKLEKGRIPCLATVLVGNDGGSIYYVNNQKKLCDELGVENRHVILDETIAEEELLEVVHSLNNDETVDGVIIQLPLPKHIDEKKITSSLNYKKDVDGLTDINLGKFYKGEDCFVPCTPQSILHLIKTTGVKLQGKHAVVVGRSNIVGKPAAQLLLNENCTVTICHSKTEELKKVCSSADILICALGKPEFITEEYIKEAAVVIDVGTSRLNGKMKGDVLFEEAIKKASFITPVPGGVGAVTTVMLIKNTCEAMKKNVY